ncbi:hypothetical protein TNIN_284261 [Trichonephila inaurata madagascariensis]|uniref:Uncharacterized protein n=1 Tax=Trichonephila inaurata madagascariensis TaxID=2747483 RepID=A0A8X6YJW5_9ARAC|nr:hypothetical protein TNIN_284261 [Trichonephila inaurata madagascariensis]
MSKPYTYGSICEVMAAGEIFPYKFPVYQDGSLIAVFGEAMQEIRRLWFTANFNEGHFDALVPLDEATINSIQISHFNEPKLLTSTEQIGCEKYFSCQHGYNYPNCFLCKAFWLPYGVFRSQKWGKTRRALACLLFNLELKCSIRNSSINSRGTIFTKTVQLLTYADNIVITARTLKWFVRSMSST